MSRYRIPGPLGLYPVAHRFDTGTPTPWRPAQPPGVAHGGVPSSDVLLASTAPATASQARDVTAAEGERIVAEAALWKDTPYADQPHLQPPGPYRQYNGAGAERGVGGDCSGSTWKVYGAAGFPYTYRASGQWSQAVNSGHIPFRRLSEGEAGQAGDVLQFNGHLAILASPGQMWTARRSGYSATGEYFNRPFTLMAIQYWGNPVIARYRYRVSTAATATTGLA
jgi:cell wall-associated NlpC family hydrolase